MLSFHRSQFIRYVMTFLTQLVWIRHDVREIEDALFPLVLAHSVKLFYTTDFEYVMTFIKILVRIKSEIDFT